MSASCLCETAAICTTNEPVAMDTGGVGVGLLAVSGATDAAAGVAASAGLSVGDCSVGELCLSVASGAG